MTLYHASVGYNIMDQSDDRMRLKDKIIYNVSKAIKSIQELLYYQSKDPVLSRRSDALTLSNGDWPCHKLCENMDHALLHGLKQVTHGYWRVFKELSHKETVKEIERLNNVTTDLGKGRAWLYSSLNEGNLESYIRMLCANNKLLKKYYAKEALMLDEDRMNILLTHTSGLECVKFHLEYDVPYLDLSACPPQTRTDSELEDYIRSASPQSQKDSSGSFRPGPEVRASSTDSTSHQASDSDSASIASLDRQSPSEIVGHMKISTISADSGYPTDGAFSDGAKQRCGTPTDTILNTRLRVATPVDSISLSSVGSSGDPDRHRRLENIVPGGSDDEDGGDSLVVIRVKSRKSNSSKPKVKKHRQSQKDNPDKWGKTLLTELTDNHSDFGYQQSNERANSESRKGTDYINVENMTGKEEDDRMVSDNSGGRLKTSLSSPGSCNDQLDSNIATASITNFDSGIDISDFAVAGDKSLTSSSHNIDVNEHTPAATLNEQNSLSSGSPHLPNNHSNSVQAQIESKIAEFCSTNNSSQRTANVKSEIGSRSNSHDATQVNKLSLDTISELKHCSESPSLSYSTRSFEHSNREQISSTVYIHGLVADSPTNKKSRRKKSSVRSHAGSSPSDNVTTKVIDSEKDWLESSNEAEDSFDVYSSNKQDSQQLCNEPNTSEVLIGSSSIQSATQLKDYMDYILQTPDSLPMDSKDKQEIPTKEVDLSLSLDNNTKLQLMLDIFTHEDEQLLKMFVTRENHPEGDSSIVFVLISDQCLYLLHYHRSTKKFVIQTSAILLDLLFISTGINEQTLNVESRGKNNQKQRLWLTPGHQALTLAIVTCLKDAVHAANELMLPARSSFSVESEVPLQNIALKKYISRELQCEAQDVTISDYSLVFWEDPSAANAQTQDIYVAYKEGTLLLRSHDPLKAYVWKPVYVVLKNSMLCVSNKKNDPRPHSYLGLGGDQCVGCRSTSATDRQHCVELILAQGGSWFLAAASQAEISEWRHALCLAVSQGTVENNSLSACIPCCAVLSCNHLFLCHEDLHTKFYRTLGRAQLEDVTGIALNDVHSTYCIIEFESQEAGVSSNQWVLYFSSVQDLKRYKKALNMAWKEIYQVDLPVWPVNSVSLQRHCSTFSDQLRQQLTLN